MNAIAIHRGRHVLVVRDKPHCAFCGELLEDSMFGCECLYAGRPPIVFRWDAGAGPTLAHELRWPPFRLPKLAIVPVRRRAAP